MKIYYLSFAVILLLIQLTNGQTTNITNTDTIKAIRAAQPISVDGLLNEPVWSRHQGITNFTQREPVEGGRPSQLTEVIVAYDETALYIGAKLYDSAPDSIVRLLGRRDQNIESDGFGVFIDPYLDRRSGYYFGLSAGGTLYDGVLMNDDWDDDAWDGVWEGEVQITEQGWTAEMRIPYSQLRFHKKNKYTWGINFIRIISRHNEEDFVVFTPKNGSGFVSRFPLLVGIENINPSRNIEALPYFRTKAEYLQTADGDPFNDGSRYLPAIGADFKLGIGNNLTLDATISPDFGQVEVDPAVVNLSDVETFYQEKRPFFIEGENIFRFGRGGSNNFMGFNWGSPDFFYSRRIGRAPGGNLPDHDYASVPDGTNILGATKLTGKVAGNWNIGAIHALTAREYADVQSAGRQFEREVEPRTYYGVLRAQKEFDDGRQGLGIISTVTDRDFKDDRLRDQMNSASYVFGLDGWTFLDKDKIWVLTGWGGASHVKGNEKRMTDLQRSSRHYFQRPDAGHISVDSSATSLTGYAGRVMLNKQKGSLLLNSALGFIDPGFDVNDAGFLWHADKINGHFTAGYQWNKPTKYYRETGMVSALFASADFDYNLTWAGAFFIGWIKFLNYYSLEAMFAYNPETLDSRKTRGGPLTKNLPGLEANFWFHSDRRKQIVIGLSSFGYTRNEDEWSRGLEIDLQWKPLTNLSLELEPEITWNREFAQWVDAWDDPAAKKTYGRRYLFGELSQTEISAGIRLNWTFTPRLSLQGYFQPLISSGDYTNFKALDRPKSYDFNIFGQGGSTIEKQDETYTVDPDGPAGIAEPYSFSDPDFNFKSLRANVVLRWEYRPGSTFYLVWTQSRRHAETIGDFQFRKSLYRLGDTQPDNILMVKVNYWLNL